MASYLRDMFSLTGRTAVVTGGSSGIGFAMAQGIGRAGGTVVLVARSPRRLEAAAQRLRTDDITVHTVAADLAQPSSGETAAEEVAALAGEPDILITAAGVNPRPPLDELTMAQYDNTMQVNVKVPFLLGQRFGPGMARRGFGRIINIGSQQSFRAFGNSGAYGVSKAAICALTRTQAEAWSSSGVCCNTVVPGFVRTPLTEPTFSVPGRAEVLAERTMIGRNGLPEDFAGIAVFLASTASAFMTGATICVDGGFSVT